MKHRFNAAFRFLNFAAVTLGASLALHAAEPTTNPATTPVPREGVWMERHEAMNERVKQGNVDLIFIGDSITQAWESSGKNVWEKYYSKRNAVNLGIGGDRTQHVLWRLENGNLEGIKPKVAVIMIGTNNSREGDSSVAEIAEGIRAIVKKLRTTLPETKILLLGIFPRGEQPNPQRGRLMQVNQIIAKLADRKTVTYLDIGPKFLNDDGSLSKEIMPDFLHLSPRGYTMWAEAIEAPIARMLGEKVPARTRR